MSFCLITCCPGLKACRDPPPASLDLLCPVIMVSGASDLVIAVEAMRIGAADYVIKETDGSYIDLLAQTIARVLAHEKLFRDKEEADARIAAQAETIQAVLDNMDPGVSLLDSGP